MGSNNLRNSNNKCKVANNNLCKWLTTAAAEEVEVETTRNKVGEVVAPGHPAPMLWECLPLK